ncbi:Trigger factor [Bienertia sinuspersici]
MDFWSKAKTFAEEAAKRSQELTQEAAKRSQDFTSTIGGSSRIADIVSETAKRSKELAAEASIQIKAEALKRADQIKSLNLLESSNSSVDQTNEVSPQELEKLGITNELREFVRDITMNTFQDFPLPDDAPITDVPTVSNVRQDLTEWQARHASLMLSTVKEISKLRYELCPRHMKERKFWRIYFMLVNNHIAPYEKSYNEAKLKEAEEEKAKAEKEKDTVNSVAVSKPDGAEPSRPLKTSTSSAEQDLDVFLLGDLGDSDGPDDKDVGDDDFDDDFDKIGDSSEDERVKDSKK